MKEEECIKCKTVHIAIEDEFLPEICGSCYTELYQKFPEYIPHIQVGMWMEGKVKKWR